MKQRKVLKKLDRKVRDFDNMNGPTVVKGSHGNYHKPGSRK